MNWTPLKTLLCVAAASVGTVLGSASPAEAQRIGRAYSGGSTSGRRSFRVTSPGRRSVTPRGVNSGRSFRSGNRAYRSGNRTFRSGNRTFRSGNRAYRSGNRAYRSGNRTFRSGNRNFRGLGRTRSGRTVVFRGGPRHAGTTRRTRRTRRRALVSRRHLAPRRRTYVYQDPYVGPRHAHPSGTRFYRYINGRLVVFDGVDHTTPRTVYYDPAYAEPAPGLPNPPLNSRVRIVPDAPVVPMAKPKPPVARSRKKPSLGGRLSAALEVQDWKAVLRIARWTKDEPSRERALQKALYAQFPSPTVLQSAAQALKARKDEPGVASLLRILSPRGPQGAAPKRAASPTTPSRSR